MKTRENQENQIILIKKPTLLVKAFHQICRALHTVMQLYVSDYGNLFSRKLLRKEEQLRMFWYT